MDVRNDVAKTVDLQNPPDPGTLPCPTRLFELGLQIILHRFPDARRRHPRGQVRAHRSEYVAAVKRLAHRMTEVLLARDVAHLALLVQVDHGEHPVIRAQEMLAAGFHQNRAASISWARITGCSPW